MQETFIIADLPVRVNVDGGQRTWQSLSNRFGPFVAPVDGEAALEVDIKCGPLPEHRGELIYDPEANVGTLLGRTYRLADGAFGFVLRTMAEPQEERLWMRLLPEQGRAEIVLAQDGGDDNPYFLSHALMLAFMITALGHGRLIIHASCIVYDGKAYLFQGKSGTGKSTHSRMWLENVPGAWLLNDDHPLIALVPDGARVYGSPWSGKTDCYRNASAPVGAFVRIVRADHNELRQLPPLLAYASLATSLPLLPFVSGKLKDIHRQALERLASTVPCCQMLCQPTPEAARACLNGIKSLKSPQL